MERTGCRNPNQSEPVNADFDIVGPRFFETVGVPILLGRGFDWRDNATGARVAVISESLASRLFGAQNPIGRSINVATAAANLQNLEVIGVARDAILWQLRDKKPAAVYTSLTQVTGGITPQLVVRMIGDPTAISEPVRRTIESMGHEIALRVETILQRQDRALVQERLIAILSSIFAGFALLLACLGLYGLTSYSVSQRTPEIGIRVALGAKPAAVVGLVIRDILTLLSIGLSVGLFAAVAGGHLISSLLYGLTQNDPWTLVGAAVILLGCGCLAAFVPARRAASINPISALRAE